MGNATYFCCASDSHTTSTVNLEPEFNVHSAAEEQAVGLPSSERKPFKAILTRTGPHWNNIGVVLSPDDSPDYLTIDDINCPSLLGFWNEASHKNQKVRVGDMIKAVNEFSSTCEQMLLMIQTIGKGEEIRYLIDPGPENFAERRSSETESNAEWLKRHNEAKQQNKVPSTPRIGSKDRSKKDFKELRPHFATLDISEKSSKDAIRRHYKRLARIWHPDKNPSNREEATSKFQAISTAYMKIKEKLDL